MSEDELEALRAKNQELLDEKKREKKRADELAEQVEQLTQERDQLNHELYRYKVERPRQEVVEQVAAEGMARPLLRELEENFDVDEDSILYSKDGQAITTEDEQPVKLDREGLIYLKANGMIPAAMLKPNRGGGAKGSRVPNTSSRGEQKTQTSSVQFGLK